MAGGGGGGGAPPRELDQTPTWAVASVCSIIIIISILLEKVLHHIGEWFRERRKKALFEALEKVKAELMILGFISLLLTFGQNYISKICIPEKAADTMLPCQLDEDQVEAELAEGGHHRRLLWDAIMDLYPKHRFLSEASSVSRCPQGKVPLISTNGLHQLHIFIFFLAVFHVLSSAVTMALGRAKIRRWKEWEKETLSTDYEFFNDPSRFRLTHEISFVRQHASFWNRSPILFYAVSFFRQFFRSVRKADYLAMRHGFITVHLAPGSKFDFQKYIKRSLEDDFKIIVGISHVLWGSAVLFLLFNVKGWHTMFIISVMPLIIILAIGTKLQAIITRMAVEIQERHAVIQGIPLVHLSDHHFWFGRPQLVLFLIHFTLFQNAFELIYFLWIWYEFGLNSCFHENNKVIAVRVCLGVGVQFVCSYVTLPLYALVSQMGSHMKKSIFDEQTSKALKKWHHEAVKKKNPPKNSPNSPPRSPSTSPRASQNPACKTMRSISLTPSGRRQYSDPDALAAKAEAPYSSSTTTMVSTVNNTDLLTGSTEHHQNGKQDEFSLVNLTDP
ncbi:MLO-like protein 9 isoform X2 [Phoenix dactylifera]|uniref:MLO-like protein n=1 Tax=Phoenix dactylifera TaxID=42345 RepID=A0A8B7CRS0_PHODC|nr:MLO-like protein 9 isoform X2 [Phoenix dactylifera]